MERLVPQAQAELQFWRDLVKNIGPEYYYAYRVSEYFEKTRYFSGFVAQEGRGIDVGCGCISVFEGSTKNVVCCDALMQYYWDLLPQEVLKKCKVNSVDYPASRSYQWAACINMIDHTPDPAFTLSQIHKSLLPGGMLYFEVNFEEGLAAPHYQVWDERTVQQRLNEDSGWRKLGCTLQNVPEHNQRRYWAVYEKVG